MDDKFDLRKDCRFDSTVKQAHWDDRLHIWHIISSGKNGVCKAAARHLIMCTVRLAYPSSSMTNDRLGFRFQAVYTKAEGTRNIPGNMESHGALAKGRDRDKRKEGWSHWYGGEWGASDPRDRETRTHGLSNLHGESLITSWIRLNILPYSNEPRTLRYPWANIASASKSRTISSKYTRRSSESFPIQPADFPSNRFSGQ